MKKILLFATLISTCTLFLQAQNTSKEIEKILQQSFDDGIFNGCVLVTKKGQVIYKNGFGFANFEWEVLNTPTTKFEIGSCTKQFTAALIMLLNEEGKIQLDSPIIKYLPNYPADKGKKITIHQLLSHTSGIPEYLNLPEVQPLVYSKNEPYQFIQTFWSKDLEFEPGSKYKYSNSGYFLLGVIIEKITEKSYEQNLKERIFNPLKMNDSGVVNDESISKNKAYGYIKSEDSLQPAPYFNATAAFSAGAIYSTVEDLFKWQNALNKNTILSEESKTKMLTPNLSHYGYGFGILPTNVNDTTPITLFGHEGEIFGFRSLIHFFKEENSSVILLDNNQNTSLMKIANQIREVIFEDE